MNLGGATLSLSGFNGTSTCPGLTVGDVETLVTTTASITGTFSGVPDGTIVSVVGPCSTPPVVRINYTAQTVTATVVAPPANFTWSGGAAVGSGNWSSATNWAGGVIPANPVGTLSFPALTSAACAGNPRTAACYHPTNDITGLNVNALSIDDGSPYVIDGNAVTLGAGGIVAAPTASSPGGFPANLDIPLTLSAPQTWSITGGPSVPPSLPPGLSFGKNVTGPGQALAINFTNAGFDSVFGGDVEVGPVTVSGSGTVSLAVSLNGTDASPVRLNAGAGIDVSQGFTTAAIAATMGPLTSTGGMLTIRSGTSAASTLAVNGGVALDASTRLALGINQAGTAPATDYSQLSATGPVGLGSATLTLEKGGLTPDCSALHPGDVDTVVTTSGALSGTFAGVPDGTVIALQNCLPSTPATFRINYTAHAVTATVVAPPAVPVNMVPPTISGSAVQGQALTESNGTWTNSPTSFTHQWQDCDTSGASCTAISGATGPSYSLAASDVGHTIRVQETASNAGGPGTPASSAASSVITVPVASPTNSSPPTISGTPAQGQTLTEAQGSWTGRPTSFSYQWEDCDSSGNTCSPIAGATSQSYVPTAADVGHTIRVQETAANAGGSSAPASSTQTTVVLPAVPSNTAPPAISGTVTQGQTLTESHGSWSNSPTSYAYQWMDCDSSGNACSAIAGATGQTYALVAGDVGHTIRVQETASNAGGSSSPASSASSGVVQAPPATATAPSNASPPAITGNTTVGATLSASAGTWSGTAPISYAYQWQRCNPGCSNIAGATGSSYPLTSTDTGSHIRVVVTASNSAGSAAAASGQVGPVAAAPPTAAQIRALLLKEITATGKAARIAALLKAGGYTLSFTAPGAGSALVQWFFLPAGAHLATAKPKPLLLASGRLTFSAAGSAKLKVKLTSAGKKLLKRDQRQHAKTLKLTAKATFTPTGATAVIAEKKFTLKR